MATAIIDSISGIKKWANESRKHLDHLMLRDLSFETTEAEAWDIPNCQRNISLTHKVKAGTTQMLETADESVAKIPGICIILAIVDGVIYLVDGQHRRCILVMSGLKSAISDVKVIYLDPKVEDPQAAMSRIFSDANACFSPMRPGDLLRALSERVDTLKGLKDACPFICFAKPSPAKPVLMTLAIKTWHSGGMPFPSKARIAVDRLAEALSQTEYNQLAAFMTSCYDAFEGTEVLWRELNLSLVSWMYRHWVIESALLDTKQFTNGLREICSSDRYRTWIEGKTFHVDFAEGAYNNAKQLILKRVKKDYPKLKKINLPDPNWGSKVVPDPLRQGRFPAEQAPARISSDFTGAPPPVPAAARPVARDIIASINKGFRLRVAGWRPCPFPACGVENANKDTAWLCATHNTTRNVVRFRNVVRSPVDHQPYI